MASYASSTDSAVGNSHHHNAHAHSSDSSSAGGHVLFERRSRRRSWGRAEEELRRSWGGGGCEGRRTSSPPLFSVYNIFRKTKIWAHVCSCSSFSGTCVHTETICLQLQFLQFTNNFQTYFNHISFEFMLTIPFNMSQVLMILSINININV